MLANTLAPKTKTAREKFFISQSFLGNALLLHQSRNNNPMTTFSLPKSDILGALASSLCVIHCVATPFLFLAHTCAITGCAETPFWWQSLDYIFLAVSFFAVARSAQQTARPLLRNALWGSWGLLALLVLNEKTALLPLPETITYVAALGLAGLHLYRLRYCSCAPEGGDNTGGTIGAV